MSEEKFVMLNYISKNTFHIKQEFWNFIFLCCPLDSVPESKVGMHSHSRYMIVAVPGTTPAIHSGGCHIVVQKSCFALIC